MFVSVSVPTFVCACVFAHVSEHASEQLCVFVFVSLDETKLKNVSD